MSSAKAKSFMDLDSDSGSSSDSDNQGLTVNKEFKEKFLAQKRRQEIKRQKNNLLEVDDEAYIHSSDSESDEDDDAVLLTADVDAHWARTLAAIRRKDPAIYDQAKDFSIDATAVATDDTTSKQSKKADTKAMSVSQITRQQLIEGGSDSDSDEEDRVIPLVEAQRRAKAAFRQAAEQDDSGEDEDDAFFGKKEVSAEQQAQDAAAMAKFSAEHNSATKEALAEVFDGDGNNDESEQFLRDYFVKGFFRETDEAKLPSYHTIMGEAHAEDEVDEEDEQDDFLDQDEEYLDEQDRFEESYNFRYEQAGADQVLTYPRQIDDSVRQTTSKRNRQREAKKQRRELEKQRRAEEVKVLKNLKKKEIQQKVDALNALSEATNIDDDSSSSSGKAKFSVADVDQDFDPDQFDAKMSDVFGDGFYDNADDDTEKPVFSDLSDEEFSDLSDDDEPTANTNNESQSSSSSSSSSATRKDTSAAKAEAVADIKKSMDEYHQLDFSGVAGGEKVRFKYVQVQPDSYGLSMHDILTLPDNKLNQRVSIRQLAPYRDRDDLSCIGTEHKKQGGKFANNRFQDPSKKRRNNKRKFQPQNNQPAGADKQKRKKRGGKSGQKQKKRAAAQQDATS